MAGCVSCFIVPLFLFIFHRYIQPIILKFWNPWAKVEDKPKSDKVENVPLIAENDKAVKRKDATAPYELNGECCVRG